MTETPFERMGQRWLGLGNLAAPVWFIGLEPGGTERPEWPEVWESRYGAGEVIDGRGEVGDPDHARWFGPNASLQNTWGPLISTRLSYAGKPADADSCLAYQKSVFVEGNGGEAVLELSAYAAKGLHVEVPREKYISIRVKRITELLEERKPEIVVCYGLTRRRDFETICGGQFDADGLRWRGATLCALTLHPKPQFRAPEPAQFWINLGAEMRRRVNERHA